jgi:hypothetical protein
MSRALFLLITALGFVGAAAATEKPIDFTRSDNLKTVYDAGFRPWRSTMFSCTVTDKNISVVLPEDAQISLPAQIATFSVLARDQMSRVDIISEVMPTDGGVAKTHEICDALGISTIGLNQSVPIFGEHSSKPSYWYGRGQKGNIAIQVSIDYLDFIDHIGTKVYAIMHLTNVISVAECTHEREHSPDASRFDA